MNLVAEFKPQKTNIMDKYELKDHASVRALAELQAELGLNDSDFARRTKLDIAASSWGKVKGGTWSGNCLNALRAVESALLRQQDAPIGTDDVEVVGGDVLMEHMRMTADAVEIARVTSDEHRLILVVGKAGAGKSTTGRYLCDQYGGTLIHARPSWARSYMHTLTELASGLGLGSEWHSAGKAERGLIDALAASPRMIIIDEANHFSRDALNLLKTILNETKCCLVMLTLPNHLAKMAAEHQEESRQLLRRSVAIVHIPQVSTDDVETVRAGLYPELQITDPLVPICNLANRCNGMDTVRRILDEMAEGKGMTQALKLVERSLKITA